MEWKKISKDKARKIFDGFGVVYLLASKLNPYNGVWVSPVAISYDNEMSFDSAVNAYRYYNCNKECGMGVSYYIPE